MNQEDYRLGQMVINVTNRCPLACTYCFVTQNPMDMSLDTAKACIDYFWEHQAPKGEYFGHQTDKNNPKPIINWFGGEPLLKYEDIIKPAMLYAESQGYDIGWGISTNCVLMTPDKLEFFRHFHTGLLLSIDGPEIIQNDQRPRHGGLPSWPDIEKNLELLAKYPWKTFRSTITARNAGIVSQSYQLARRYGFDQFFCGMDFTDPDWTQEKYELLAKEILDIAFTYYADRTYGIKSTTPMQLIEAIKEEFEQHNRPENLTKRCGLGTSTIGVAPDGKFFGCQEHSSYNNTEDLFYMGDVFTGVNHKKREELLNKYIQAADRLSEDEYCKDCRLKGDCYAANCPSLMSKNPNNFAERNPNFCAQRRIWSAVATAILTTTLVQKNEAFIKNLEEEFGIK